MIRMTVNATPQNPLWGRALGLRSVHAFHRDGDHYVSACGAVVALEVVVARTKKAAPCPRCLRDVCGLVPAGGAPVRDAADTKQRKGARDVAGRSAGAPPEPEAA